MKGEITKICGYLMFIAFTIGAGFYCYVFYWEVIDSTYPLRKKDEMWFILIVPLCLFVVFYYLISTRFWVTQPNELQNELQTIEYENEILKKEIEREELLEKLGK